MEHKSLGFKDKIIVEERGDLYPYCSEGIFRYFFKNGVSILSLARAGLMSLKLIYFSSIFLASLQYFHRCFNAKLWNIYKSCVLQVLIQK